MAAASSAFESVWICLGLIPLGSSGGVVLVPLSSSAKIAALHRAERADIAARCWRGCGPYPSNRGVDVLSQGLGSVPPNRLGLLVEARAGAGRSSANVRFFGQVDGVRYDHFGLRLYPKLLG